MRKIFIIAVLSILSIWLPTGLVLAQVKVNTPERDKNAERMIKFLQAQLGKEISQQDLIEAERNCVISTGPSRVTGEVRLSENFDLLTAGSEEAPDEAEIDDETAATLMPDLIPWHVHQAGGKAYLALENNDGDDPGYLMTKDLDLSQNQGVMRVTFKVKNVNEDDPEQGLQYFVLDNTPDNKGMIAAASLPMSTDWTECSFISLGGCEHTSIMFFGWRGKILVDGITVEQLNYELETPKNIKAEVAGGGSLTITWDAVENATSYLVEIYNKDSIIVTDNLLLASSSTESNTATIEAAFDPTVGVYVRVIALSEDGDSYPGYLSVESLSVSNVDAPVALEGSEITENGFTANWEASTYANQYELSLIRTHEATEDGEIVTYFDDEFEKSPYGLDNPRSTVMTTDGKPVVLNDYLIYPGWSLYLGICATDYLGITNMYAPYGYPGALFGPVGDYSLGDGKAHVEGVALTSVDDVVLKIGFGKLDTTSKEITYLGEPQEVTIGTTPSSFEVDINGGAEESQIIIEITDSAEAGDFALFDSLKITSTMVTGDIFTGPYEVVTLPYDQTSYTVEVPFTGNDKFDYTVVGIFGSTRSEESNVITVYAPEPSSVDQIRLSEGCVTVYDLNGNKILDKASIQSIESLDRGVYIVRQSDKIYKVMR